MQRVNRSAACAFGFVLLAVAALDVEGQARAVTPDDYDQWERLGPATLSPRGDWMAVSISRVDDDSELRIHRTDSDSVVVVPFGARPAFSADNLWLAYSIGVSEEEREAAQERDETAYNDLGLLNLRTGEQTVRESVQSFSFSDDGAFLSLRRYKPKDKESAGVDVVVHDLERGTDMAFGNVSDFAWQEGGSLLAMTRDADGQVGNGVSVYDPTTGRLRTLDSDEATYRRLAWRDDSSDLVVFKTFEDDAFEDTAHVALAWRGLALGDGTMSSLDPRDQPAFPATMRIVEHRAPTWSADGASIFFGIQARIPKPPQCADDEDDEDGEGAEEGSAEGADPGDNPSVECHDDDVAGVEIWHTRDVDPVPQQRVRESRLREQNFVSVWHLDDGAFVQLGDDLTENISLLGTTPYVLGANETPYDEHAMFRQQFSDLYAIDARTGAKQLVEERVAQLGGSSPTGRFVIWFDDEQWYAHDLRAGTTANLTEGLNGTFVNLDVTPTREEMPPFGVAGWLEGDRGVLLRTQWDVWHVQLDGSGGERLTDGADEEVRYNVLNTDFDDEVGLDPNAPLYYSLYSEWTKEAGFGRADLGDEIERLVWDDKMFGGFFTPLLKAEEADVWAFRMESYDDSPDWFVANASLDSPRQVTRTNPFQADFAWGRTELVDYQNEWGRRLQGVLTYPAGYDPDESYPMIVYHYELLSQGMHQYQVPDPTQYYNQQIWAQDGYFVLRPDIVYRDRRPGQSNVETLRPAVAAALAQAPAIDAERVGLIGHSWGGYQTTYFVTQDDLFASAVAGAPLTNLMSMYLSFYWNSGGTDARIFEISQGRMQVPWWEDWDSYEANSPIHHIENMNTPLLMMFGTNDGAVEYNQGVEFYNAARRLGKQMVMLSYDGENHGLAREPNQRDYQHRIMQWFAHYLKGEPAPDWISEGVPYLLQKDRLRPNRPIG